MPNDALIAGALALGGEGLNAAFTGGRNKRAYERSVAMWKMQNVYNSPEQQMERFKRAGLNPNLIYGNGASASNAGPVQTPDIAAQHLNIGGVADKYYDVRQKTLMADNLKAQNTVLLEEALLKRAQTRATLANAGLGEYSLDFRKQTQRADIFKAEESANLIASKRLASDQNLVFMDATMKDRIRGVGLTNDLRSSQYDYIKQNIANAKQRHDINAFELSLNKNGLTRADPMYLRLLSIFLKGIGINVDTISR